MRDFFLSRIRAFRYAFHGWLYVIRSQRNAWIHAWVSLTVIIVSIWLGLSPGDWAIIIIAITMVWTSEFINTALEAVVDLSSPQHHPLARVGKDVGAAAVLIAALSSATIGLLILGPPLWTKLTSLFLSR